MSRMPGRGTRPVSIDILVFRRQLSGCERHSVTAQRQQAAALCFERSAKIVEALVPDRDKSFDLDEIECPTVIPRCKKSADEPGRREKFQGAGPGNIGCAFRRQPGAVETALLMGAKPDRQCLPIIGTGI